MLLAKENIVQYGIEEQIPVPKRKVKVSKRKKFKLKAPLIVSTSIVLAFLLGVFLASQYARLATTGYDIVSMKKELTEMQTENERLQSQYTQLQSLDRVEEIATTKLGMVSPTTEGFIYIPVESKYDTKEKKQDNDKSTKSIASRNSETQEKYLEKITDFVKNWTADINQAEGRSLN